MTTHQSLIAFKEGQTRLKNFISTHVDLGWHIVLLPVNLYYDYTDYDEMSIWLRDNIQGQISKWNYVWFFELQEDAAQFKLRWM